MFGSAAVDQCCTICWTDNLHRQKDGICKSSSCNQPWWEGQVKFRQCNVRGYLNSQVFRSGPVRLRNNRLALMGVILRLTATIAKHLTGRDDDAESFTVASSLVCFVQIFTPLFVPLSSFLSFICLPSAICLYFFPSFHLKFVSFFFISCITSVFLYQIPHCRYQCKVEPLPSRVNCEWRPNFTYGGQPIEGSPQFWESVLS